MTAEEAARLTPGLYRIFWKQHEGGKTSFAAIGQRGSGGVWCAPANWLMDHVAESEWDDNDWARVERVEMISVCDTPVVCTKREALVRLGKEKLDLKQPIDPDAAAVVRDAFLAGDDVDAIAVLSECLNMTTIKVPGRELVEAVDKLLAAIDRDDETPLGISAAIDRLRRAHATIRKSLKPVYETDGGTQNVTIKVGDLIRAEQTFGANTSEFLGEVLEVSRSGSSMMVRIAEITRVRGEAFMATLGASIRIAPQDVRALMRTPGDWITLRYSERIRFEPRTTRMSLATFEPEASDEA